MRVEIACEHGTIRLSDRRMAVGASSLSDLLEEMVGTLRALGADDDHVVLSRGEFGFAVRAEAEEDDESVDE
jgi:hypothetical protein